MQFINLTSKSAQISLLLGDLNTYDHEAGFKMLQGHTKLKDAYIEANVKFLIQILISLSLLFTHS